MELDQQARTKGEEKNLARIGPSCAHDLEDDKRGILRRKWVAVLSVGGSTNRSFQRLRSLVDQLVPLARDRP